MKTFDITDYGACSDGKICTDAIQKAIDECFKNNGGTVIVPKGRFVTGGVRLRSNVTLYLKSGARLEGSRNPEDYLSFINDEIEPFKDEYKTSECWKSVTERKNYDFMCFPCGRWGNGIIRAIDAENIAIIGEKNSEINGMNCFDEIGEEHYRGPHAISMHNCKKILFSGYSIRDSADWAHMLLCCTNIEMKNVNVYAGHDGIHLTSCDNTKIEKCVFQTGDDCVAGIDNINTVVQNCELNTACSAFRFGGTNFIAENCKIYGPAKYLFRGSLSDDEKRSGKEVEMNKDHRYNMLSAFTYYCDFSRSIRQTPGNITVKNCTIENADRFLHYNFSGNEPWQSNEPLLSIRFENIKAKGIKMPLTAYGKPEKKVSLELIGCDISFDKDVPFLQAAYYDKIVVKDTVVGNIKTAPFAKIWSDGEIITDNVVYNNREITVENATEPFHTQSI